MTTITIEGAIEDWIRSGGEHSHSAIETHGPDEPLNKYPLNKHPPWNGQGFAGCGKLARLK